MYQPVDTDFVRTLDILHEYGGWLIVLDEIDSLVFALDPTTGSRFWLETRYPGGEWCGITRPESLRDALDGMDIAEAIERGRLRVRGAIHEAAGCPKMGGLIC